MSRGIAVVVSRLGCVTWMAQERDSSMKQIYCIVGIRFHRSTLLTNQALTLASPRSSLRCYLPSWYDFCSEQGIDSRCSWAYHP
jgi:hypothetical protein